MSWTPFKVMSKKFLGIDIGTSSIKIVELSKSGKRLTLENYGEISTPGFSEEPFRTFEKNTLLISTDEVAKAILAILEEAKIKIKKASFSIPDFASFFTWFDLPPLTEKEIPQAVNFAARSHIPLPLSEVTLDWQIIEGKPSDRERTKLKILLVAVPNKVINQYQEIARISHLELQALGAEVFGLSKSLIRDEKKVIALVDIGIQTTTCSIIDNGILKRSHSFDIAGNNLTFAIAKSLNIDYNKAEELKRKLGLINEENPVREIILPLIDLILAEIVTISEDFAKIETKKVEKVILAGGSALTPGLKGYFQERLQKEVEIANPFSDIFYPPILENTLKEAGPSYAIAVGMARQGLE